jgi:hypothetical protein
MRRTRAYDAMTVIRLTRAERDRLKGEARRHGRSLSRYLVERGLTPAPAMGPEQRLAHEQRMIHLRRIDRTLSQIAAALNAGRGVAADRLSAAMSEVMAAVGVVQEAGHE